jgi:hypothetical protein
VEHREINWRTLSFCSVACMFKRLLRGKGFGDTILREEAEVWG